MYLYTKYMLLLAQACPNLAFLFIVQEHLNWQ